MRRYIPIVFLLILGACAAPGTQQQTLVAHQTFVATEQERIAQVGTVEYERLLVTLEYSQTQVARALNQQNAMISTLEARGFVVNILPAQAAPSTPTLPITTTTPNDEAQPTATPQLVITPFFTPQPAQPTITNAAVPSSPLSDFVMASSVGADDCAQSITNQFSPQTAEIYVVARARNTPAGTQFLSRWFNQDTGEELAAFDFTPDFAIDDACIWFYATADDFPFNAGNYAVVLEVNGQPISGPIPFVITTP
ncbi:MAG: hypothetical protein Kow00117_05870 [Phototrophicales bacterium]